MSRNVSGGPLPTIGVTEQQAPRLITALTLPRRPLPDETGKKRIGHDVRALDDINDAATHKEQHWSNHPSMSDKADRNSQFDRKIGIPKPLFHI